VFRLRHLVPAVLALAAIAPGPATAEPSATFATSLRLLDQPAGRPWRVQLALAGEFADSGGIDAQPILQTLTFDLPDATVNASGVPTCSADPTVSVGNSVDICPPRLAVGWGTSDVQLRRPPGIDLRGRPPFYAYHLRLALYIGPKVPGGRVLMLIGNGVNSPMTVIMRGVLRRSAAGWIYTVPVPLVSDPEIGVMKVQRFAMRVGAFNRARPRRWFLEAPRVCPPAGFAFTMRTQFEGAAPLTSTLGFGCELAGV
jgi:hypothetical protein